MSISLSSCVKSIPEEIMNYREVIIASTNTTNTTITKKVINFYPLFAPPFVTTYFEVPKMDVIPKEMVCGAFINILKELSLKFDYRYLRFHLGYILVS